MSLLEPTTARVFKLSSLVPNFLLLFKGGPAGAARRKKRCPRRAGRSPGWPGPSRTLRFGGGPVGVPSRPTSQRAITPRQGGKPGNVSRRSTRKVAPLTQRDRATPGQTGWNTKPPACVALPVQLRYRRQRRPTRNDGNRRAPTRRSEAFTATSPQAGRSSPTTAGAESTHQHQHGAHWGHMGGTSDRNQRQLTTTRRHIGAQVSSQEAGRGHGRSALLRRCFVILGAVK